MKKPYPYFLLFVFMIRLLQMSVNSQTRLTYIKPILVDDKQHYVYAVRTVYVGHSNSSAFNNHHNSGISFCILLYNQLIKSL